MPLFFNAKIAGTETLAFRLETPLKDFTVPTAGFGEGLWGFFRQQMETEALDQFAHQGGISGSWAELSTVSPPKGGYAARKARKYGDRPILQATGDLFRSFFEGGEGNVYESRPLGMRWGSENPLAGYHQRGHTSPTRLPQRKIWDPDPDFFGRLRSGAVRYVAARYRMQGFRLLGEPSENPLRMVSRAEASAAGREWFTGAA